MSIDQRSDTTSTVRQNRVEDRLLNREADHDKFSTNKQATEKGPDCEPDFYRIGLPLCGYFCPMCRS